MPTQFKMVLYEPRPFSGYRFPLGAIVRQGEYEYVLVNEALDEFDWSVIGIRAEFVYELLARLDVDFGWYGDVTASKIGYPFINMTDAMDIPDDVEDVQDFIRGLWGKHAQGA